MSVTNRKMFKRNARETLNQTAGIRNLPVQKFRVGGAVLPAQKAAFSGYVNRTPGQVLGSDTRFLPPIAGDGDPILNITARQALEGGIGSLSTPQLAYLQGQYEKNKMRSALGDPQPGEAPAASITRDIVGGLGQASGMLQGLVVSPFVASEPDPNIFGGELASQTPDKQFLESIGYQFYTPQTTEEAAAKAQQVRQGPARLTAFDEFPAFPLAQEEARKEAMLGVQEFPEVLPGDIFQNQEPPQVPYAPDRSGPDLDLSAAETEATETEATETEATETETTTTTETTTDSSGTYDDAIVRIAREANKEQGIPDTGSATSEINIAKETGTGSVEDLKAEYLKLLPKYEEDPSVSGLNIALMGFTIAGGESPNAMKNIADGMKQVMPNFIKSAEKRKAFERESELVAAKFAIERDTKNKDRTFNRNNYFVTSDFTGGDGVEYKAGQMLRLNDAAFDVLGGGSNLMDGATYRQFINDRADIQKAKITANASSTTNIDDFYSPIKKKTFGTGDMALELDIYNPTVAGSNLGLNNTLAGDANGQAWASITEQYVNNLDAMAQADETISGAIDLVNRGAVGLQGTMGNLRDATNAFVGPELASKMGVSSELSPAGELENLNRIMSLQMARIILNEGGKMISNQERLQVAKSLGYNDAQLDNSGNIILGSYNNVFTSKRKAIDALENVRDVIRNRAQQSSSNYMAAAKYLGYDFKPVEEAGQDAKAFGGFYEKRDDGKYHFVQQ